MPFGQLAPGPNVSAEESTAKMTSTLRSGWISGWIGMFWRSSPPSTRVRERLFAPRFFCGFQPRKGLGDQSAMSSWSFPTLVRMLVRAVLTRVGMPETPPMLIRNWLKRVELVPIM